MLWLLTLLILLGLLSYHQLSLHKATLAFALLLGAYLLLNGLTPLSKILWFAYLVIFIPLTVPFIRRRLISCTVFQWMKTALPTMSNTEREALDAGNTWWDGELFSGKPDWKVLQALPIAQLTSEEQDFLDNEVENLCAMLNDWDITHKRKDLPPEVWTYIKQHKFCGMMIPKVYGGLAFSETAHSEVVMKIASRCSTAAVTVMVPNSLGPAKLLLNYGTEAQKNYYLPRLVTGEEIPAFALTSPVAGSDAGAMTDTGIVCTQDGVLGVRLNWEKRYITLGPIATVLGLAFKLYDPDKLIGDTENIGITVALIPTHTAGVSIGRRHNPLDSAFQNGPNWGKDVFIPLDYLLGGVAQAGNGWTMLMHSLTTGRAVSLPALSVAAAKFTCRNTGAYARIRKQFNVPIGELEGIEEPLARIAGETYILNAARCVTNAALDNGERPAVISAILKYELTERMRRVVNDGMDIQGGSGICLGSKNYLGRLYQVIPISITVEGANILTRTMMIFGQGAIRCHPFIQAEMAAIQNNDLAQFDSLLFQHLGFWGRNKTTALWLGLTNARFYQTLGDNDTQRYYQQIARLSAGFALATDFALVTLGGSLKRKERLSGRFADVLSNLYLCSCVLKYYEHQGSQTDDAPLLHWACQHTLYRAQQALLAIFWQLPFRPAAWPLRGLIFPFGKPNSPPSDKLTHQTAALLLHDSETRDRLTQGIYINHHPDDATGRIEVAFKAVLAAAPVEAKIRAAKLHKADNSATRALERGIISEAEVQLVHAAEQARLAAISVDDFSAEEMLGQ
ncbi:MAG: acyl-CoA dehydrogenase [Methylococcales bacterium]|nr:acyl-CoA dehydrogenase [Methylococcales bacterium]